MQWQQVTLAVAVPVALITVLWVLARLGRGSERGSPVRRLVVFSAGASESRLRKAPTDESVYLGLGSMVLATSAVAAGSMFLALRVAYEHSRAPAWTFAGLGVCYGLVIYTIDRFLVSLQLNPVRFPVARMVPTEPVVDRPSAGRIITTLLIAVPRVLLAVLIGFLIAEPALLTLFDNEIDKRVSAIREELGEEAAAGVLSSYQDQIDQKAKPVLGVERRDALQRDVDDLTRQIDAERRAEQREEGLAQAEEAGDEVSVEGTTTSGAPTCKDLCRGHQLRQQAAATRAAQLEAERAGKQKELDKLRTEVDDKEVTREREYRELVDKTVPDEQKAKRAEAKETDGLLIRIEALNQIADDASPYSVSDSADRSSPSPAPSAAPSASPAPAASGAPSAASSPSPSASPSPSVSSSAGTATPRPSATPSPTETVAAPAENDATQATRHVFGLTTLGLAVWLVRLWLVLLDAMPVLLKVALALRPRRPYDTIVAQEEEQALSRASIEVDKARAAAYVTKRNLLVSATEGRPPRLFVRGPAGTYVVEEPQGVTLGPDGLPQARGSDPAGRVGVVHDGLDWRVTTTAKPADPGSNGHVIDLGEGGEA